MGKFTINGYDSYSGCDIVVTAKFNIIRASQKEIEERVYSLGSLQTLSVSTHQDKKPVRAIGYMNVLDYTMGQRTIAGSLVFAVFDKHFATQMFEDLEKATGKTFFLPDELPGLDITITFANEYGKKSRMAIYGLRIINEGQVMSINDLYTENTYQFVATAMEPLKEGISSGNSRRRNNPLGIVSSNKDIIDNSISTNGENIYTEATDNNYQLSKKIVLSADIEQPTLINQEGIASFYLTPSQDTGCIKIKDKLTDQIISELSVTNNNRLYNIYLKSSSYSAWYEENDKVLSNNVDFQIISISQHNKTKENAPIIQSVSASQILGYTNGVSHTKAIIVKTDNINRILHTVDIQNRYFKFEDLDSHTEYSIYTCDDFHNNSNTVQVKTSRIENEVLLGFIDYVRRNKNILSESLDKYEDILERLQDNNILALLMKEESIEAKELIFLAIKYTNEITAMLNNNNIAIKDITNPFGERFIVPDWSNEAIVFNNKNNKLYFEFNEKTSNTNYITYVGKPNRLYSVISKDSEYKKSAIYNYFSYSFNELDHMIKLFGNVNMLNKLPVVEVYNRKLSYITLKCLTANINKRKDMNILRAPYVLVDEDSSILIDLDYIDIVSSKDEYLLCICNLDECLDTTPVKKIAVKLQQVYKLLKEDTFINNKGIYAFWIEDEDCNVISDYSFSSYDVDTIEYNMYTVAEESKKILRKLEQVIKVDTLYTELSPIINSYVSNIKNIYQEIALLLYNMENNNKIEYIYELYKIKHNESYINQEKYKEVVYSKKTNKLEFQLDDTDILINVNITKDLVTNNELETNYVNIGNNDNSINIYYITNKNPLIKSGFVFVYNNQILNHKINIIEVE